jgi:hypothetical protein
VADVARDEREVAGEGDRCDPEVRVVESASLAFEIGA